jgi:hypothetical protein
MFVKFLDFFLFIIVSLDFISKFVGNNRFLFTLNFSNMLHLYYTNLDNSQQRRAFLSEIMKKCRVGYPTARSWVMNPKANSYRSPKPVYWPILADITGIAEEKLFKNKLEKYPAWT